ncbi:hypothetical protein SCP_1000580 [Sparassis crispa]|uniref:Uncharacterized protein n=1 Tax=Sparassis crispa TaxID=139825 RepID=A0A401GX55_9APHY|nr:hypothetical protein SCP_1000580 [Sparassis crispa]GBE86816.1 hypothetical protein SCP_1000580 [Sparassis crispa]
MCFVYLIAALSPGYLSHIPSELIESTFVPLFIGLLGSAILFGVTNVQTFIYFRQYPEDTIWNKLSICYLWLLDALHFAFSGYFVYSYTMRLLGGPISLGFLWSCGAEVMVMGTIMISVHTLYTIRIWKCMWFTRFVQTLHPYGYMS